MASGRSSTASSKLRPRKRWRTRTMAQTMPNTVLAVTAIVATRIVPQSVQGVRARHGLPRGHDAVLEGAGEDHRDGEDEQERQVTERHEPEAKPTDHAASPTG